MKRMLLAIVALGLAACAAPAQDEPAPSPPTQTADAACTARGGQMERVGRAQTLQCVISYADAGKACTDGSQCAAGRCQGPMEAASRENVTGQCQPSNTAFGCYTTITNGRMGAAICVD